MEFKKCGKNGDVFIVVSDQISVAEEHYSQRQGDAVSKSETLQLLIGITADNFTKLLGMYNVVSDQISLAEKIYCQRQGDAVSKNETLQLLIRSTAANCTKLLGKYMKKAIWSLNVNFEHTVLRYQ